MTSIPQDPAAESGAIVERPDGYYWIADEDVGEIGPFESFELAQADRDALAGDAPEPGETLQEAEDEIGMHGWLDSQTGEPAEGQSPPHLEGD
jgi:hypothetical protein